MAAGYLRISGINRHYGFRSVPLSVEWCLAIQNSSRMRQTICILALSFSSVCAHSQELFREVAAPTSGVRWVHQNGHSAARYLPETAGPGVAIFDYNNDGLMDILLVDSGT